ncbi:hypothetical protein JAAARDRAFT_47342 [Jaapia argillacea MUCL 33604]|uniref:F-box domain-containing protein n=1 Tax=Jaapia argillacea MUCL 33604 TaxID=933084 RepID=A0A067PWH8_9AGAM|nr:hypothetical protein JAAARDRAFT_47342 [Jaapia argillacea MUCL 33604]
MKDTVRTKLIVTGYRWSLTKPILPTSTFHNLRHVTFYTFGSSGRQGSTGGGVFIVRLKKCIRSGGACQRWVGGVGRWFGLFLVDSMLLRQKCYLLRSPQRCTSVYGRYNVASQGHMGHQEEARGDAYHNVTVTHSTIFVAALTILLFTLFAHKTANTPACGVLSIQLIMPSHIFPREESLALLREVSRSNTLSIIRDMDLTQEQLRTEEDIITLEAQIGELRERLQTLNQELAGACMRKGLASSFAASPIRKLPPEVLGRIFTAARVDTITRRTDVLDPFLQVCRHWSQVALNPAIWSTIRVEYYSRGEDPAELVPALGHLLQRSGRT